MKFKTEITTTRTASAPSQVAYQTEGLFRSASATVDIRDLLNAGRILRELLPAHLDALQLHPIARTASHNLIRARIVTASDTLSRLSEEQLKALRQNAVRAMMKIRTKKNPEEAKIIYDSPDVQDALWTWAMAETTMFVSKATSKFGMYDEEEVRSIAHEVVRKAFSEGTLNEETGKLSKKSPLSIIQTHSSDLAADLLQTLRIYLHTASNNTVTDLKRKEAKEGKRVNLTGNEGENRGEEDWATDNNTPETALMASADANDYSVQVERLKEGFASQKRIFMKELSKKVAPDDTVGIAEQKKFTMRYKNLIEVLGPKLEEMEEVADDMLMLMTARVSPEEKEAKLDELRIRYQALYGEFTQIGEMNEKSDASMNENKEKMSNFAFQKAEEVRRQKRREMEKQGLPIDEEALSVIDPTAAAKAAEQKVRKKDVLDKNGKLLISPLDKKMVVDQAWALAEKLTPNLIWAATFRSETDAYRDSRANRLHTDMGIRAMIDSKATLEAALSPDPAIRATAPKSLLATIALWKAMIVMNQVDNFNAHHRIVEEKGRVDVRSRLMQFVQSAVERDPALQIDGTAIEDAVSAVASKVSPDVLKMIDYKTRVAAYQWAKHEVAPNIMWSDLTPEQNEQISSMVLDNVYSGEKDHMSLGNAEAGDPGPTPESRKIAWRPSKVPGLSPEVRRQLLKLELSRIQDEKKGVPLPAWGWAAKVNEAADFQGDAVRYKGRAKQIGPSGGDSDMGQEMAPEAPILSENDPIMASRIDLLVRVGTRLERQGRTLEAARVARVVAGLLS